MLQFKNANYRGSLLPLDKLFLQSKHTALLASSSLNSKNKKQVGIDFEKNVWLQEEPSLRGKRELLLFGLLVEVNFEMIPQWITTLFRHYLIFTYIIFFTNLHII